jgi:hypothetical protein
MSNKAQTMNNIMVVYIPLRERVVPDGPSSRDPGEVTDSLDPDSGSSR